MYNVCAEDSTFLNGKNGFICLETSTIYHNFGKIMLENATAKTVLLYYVRYFY